MLYEKGGVKMAVKDEIIRILEQNRGRYLSGEELAGTLHVSRAAIWKAIRKLQEDGFDIQGVNNKGYMLAENTDVLSVTGRCKVFGHRLPGPDRSVPHNRFDESGASRADGRAGRACDCCNGTDKWNGKTWQDICFSGGHRHLFQYSFT